MAQIAVRKGAFRVLETIRCYRFESGWFDLEAGTMFTFADPASGLRIGGENCLKVKTSGGKIVYLPEQYFVTEKVEVIS